MPFYFFIFFHALITQDFSVSIHSFIFEGFQDCFKSWNYLFAGSVIYWSCWPLMDRETGVLLLFLRSSVAASGKESTLKEERWALPFMLTQNTFWYYCSSGYWIKSLPIKPSGIKTSDAFTSQHCVSKCHSHLMLLFSNLWLQLLSFSKLETTIWYDVKEL